LDNEKRVITKRSMVAAISGGAEDGKLDRHIEHLPNGSVLLSSGQHIEFSLPRSLGWLSSQGTGRRLDRMTSVAPKIHPALLALSVAPVDDEPTTDRDLEAIDQARAQRLSGKPMTSLEDVAKELGIEL
jgi:hypothetical protein